LLNQATCIGVRFLAHIQFVVNRAQREVATMPFRRNGKVSTQPVLLLECYWCRRSGKPKPGFIPVVGELFGVWTSWKWQ